MLEIYREEIVRISQNQIQILKAVYFSIPQFQVKVRTQSNCLLITNAENTAFI